MNEMLEQQKGIFSEEAQELLVELEAALLELEDSPSDMELVGRVFRALHSIKGSGAMFGFDSIASFLHNVETTFGQVRNGKLAVTRQLIDLTLSACDIIRRMLDGDPADEDAAKKALEFRTLLAAYEDTPVQFAKNAKEVTRKDQLPRSTFPIRFEPSADLLATGTNPCLLLDELRSLGKSLVFAQIDRVPVLSEIELIGTMLVEAGAVTADKVESALAEQKYVRDNREKRAREESVGSIRVASDKLDRLVNLVGELVTVQAQLSQTAVSSNNAGLVTIAEEVERLTAELRESAMSIRMLPMGFTFGRFRRLVRDRRVALDGIPSTNLKECD